MRFPKITYRPVAALLLAVAMLPQSLSAAEETQLRRAPVPPKVSLPPKLRQAPYCTGKANGAYCQTQDTQVVCQDGKLIAQTACTNGCDQGACVNVGGVGIGSPGAS